MQDSRKWIRHRVSAVFRNIFENDKLEIFDEMTAKDFEEWNSLAHISLVVALEREFKIRLSAAEIGRLDNVGAMLELIERKAVKA